MNTGSCGVFVKSLEDEFMEVRTAGVDSLCELANQNPPFARMSTDFLVDMFNDEIESVRLNSIDSLMKLHKYVDLREDQLDTILECLNDFNQVVRNSVRDLLSQCKLATQSCLHATVLALLANLEKYSGDRQSIWRCVVYICIFAFFPHNSRTLLRLKWITLRIFITYWDKNFNEVPFIQNSIYLSLLWITQRALR